MRGWLLVLAWVGLTAWLMPPEIFWFVNLAAGNVFFCVKWLAARSREQKWILAADSWEEAAIEWHATALSWQGIALRSPRQLTGHMH